MIQFAADWHHVNRLTYLSFSPNDSVLATHLTLLSHRKKYKGPLLVLSFLDDLDGKECVCNAGDLGSIPGLVRDPLEKVMATHSSIFDWEIP